MVVEYMGLLQMSREKISQKLRLIYLLKILHEETDDNHSLTRNQISEKFDKIGLDIPDRDTFADDIKQLIAFGNDIVIEKVGRDNHYHIGGHDFELPELKLIIDSVQSSRFLSESKSQKLIDRLEKYTSIFEAEKLNRQVYVKDRIKTDNNKSYYAIDVINEAINKDCKISFRYFEYIVKRMSDENGKITIIKDKIYRHDKKMYIVNPWTLISNNQNYYLVGYEDGEGIKHFRVDRMTDVSLIDEPVVKDVFAGMKIADYAEKRFEMFDGDEKDVVLKFKDKMYAILDDRFGRKLDVEVIDDEYLKTSVRVCVSDHFVCWILSLGDDIEISGPLDVRDGVKKLLEHRLELYK